jgi:hypothetical protein
LPPWRFRTQPLEEWTIDLPAIKGYGVRFHLVYCLV